MYAIVTTGRRAEKEYYRHVFSHSERAKKVLQLQESPRRALGAHPLKGKLRGKWACWLARNIRMVYLIDDKRKILFVDRVGSHKIY